MPMGQCSAWVPLTGGGTRGRQQTKALAIGSLLPYVRDLDLEIWIWRFGVEISTEEAPSQP